MKKYDYDVVIIGAGIGGLICANYLIQSGLKVAIVEQHFQVGGYCTSFQRKGYNFDIGVHYLSGIKRGVLGKILKELKLHNVCSFVQHDPTDKVILPEHTFCLRANPQDTIGEFKKAFPKQSHQLDQFFSFILQNEFLNIYRQVKKATFRELLDRYFDDERLKGSLNVLLGGMGLSAKEASAIAATVLFREYILDMGYAPLEGMQKFPNQLAENFKRQKGDLFLSSRVVEIAHDASQAKSVTLEDQRTISAKIFVSNSDVRNLFAKLLKGNLPESKAVKSLISSPSFFVVCLGQKENLKPKIKINNTIWCSTYSEMNYFQIPEIDLIEAKVPLLICSSSLNKGKESLRLLAFAPYSNKNFWKTNQKIIADNLVKLADQNSILLKNNVEILAIATPHTYEKYTSNYKGAAFGWALIPTQIRSSVMPNITSISNLYLTGHWTTGGLGQMGASGASISGRKVAEMIIRKTRKKWNHGIIRT
ncbi:MAG: NAD(P)/FAD-dependent oxidoreductase [Candidatus Omnitrophica bacterium]|nr:NAD(P)/FAD-dependent oxidoreductase [Candidatus Omnitrophota bacterium]